ncbi:MAG TPA: serine hydrolase [Gemmatimonadales bacterium]|nr:serine hydrolase [Gemmatimonadales bacterium]
MITSALLVLLAQTQAPDFTGLWEAALRFGPDIRGTAIVYQTPEGWRADFAGFQVPAQVAAQAVTFELPDGKGAFRGQRVGTRIVGHWFSGRTASSATLEPFGTNRWRGTITPLENRFTFYMPITRKADGTLATYLRNPERNQGRFIRAQRIEIKDEDVRLVGTGGRPDSTLSIGRYYDDGVIRLPLRGGTYDFTKVTDSSTHPFFPRGYPPPRYRYTRPLQLDDGWIVAPPESVGISRDSIEKFVQLLLDMPMDSLSSTQMHSLLIARHGKLVVEEYFHGTTRDQPHDLRSASKSWVAILIGAAMQAGIPIRTELPVYQTMLGTVPPDLDPRKRAMTLEHLLTMTAGFNCNPDDSTSADEDQMNQRGLEDWWGHTLNVPLVFAPGDSIYYCSMEPNLAVGMLARIARTDLTELSERLLQRPLQQRNYHIGLNPNGQPYGGGGFRFTTRDFAKWAQLMVSNGRWNGKQLVSADWVRRSTAPLRNLSAAQQYGYLWNSAEYPYNGRKVRAYFAAGNGGQISMGIPELDLVIVFTGGNYADPALFRPQRQFVPLYILPAID